MSMLDVPVDDAGIDEIGALLGSDVAQEARAMLAGADGLVTGIAVGPVHVAPREWLPLIRGDRAPAFADDSEAQSALTALLVGHYNDVLRQVAEGDYVPVAWETTVDLTFAAPWAEGFAVAMALRPAAWRPLVADKRRGALLLPIIALCDGDTMADVWQFEPALVDRVRRKAPALLPGCVMGIAEFWQRRRSGRAAGKVGRNDACPCGSGRKFKRCCGAG